nr:MAG TPA: hypothetical protein [Caudoviricetes sp.]
MFLKALFYSFSSLSYINLIIYLIGYFVNIHILPPFIILQL